MKIEYIGNKRAKKLDGNLNELMNANTPNFHDQNEIKINENLQKDKKNGRNGYQINGLNTKKSNKNQIKFSMNIDNEHKKDSRRHKILDQLNFYFSDENIVNDRYFKGLLQSNNEQSVKIETLLTFNKIKHLLKDINEDYRYYYICISVKNYSNFLCLSSNQKAIKRTVEFNFSKFKEIQNEIDEKTVFIESKQKLSNKKIEELFNNNKIIYFSKNKNFVIFYDKITADDAINYYNKTESESNLNLKEKKGKGITKGKNSSINIYSKKEWLIKCNSENNPSDTKMEAESYKYSIITKISEKYVIKDHIFNSLKKKKIKEIRFANVNESDDSVEVIAIFNNLEERNNSIEYFSDKEYKLLIN